VAKLSGGEEVGIPDPFDDATFESARLRWDERELPAHARWLEFHRELLSLRAREIVPRLPLAAGQFEIDRGLLRVTWPESNGRLLMQANMSALAVARSYSGGQLIHSTHADATDAPPWYVEWRWVSP